MNKTLALSLFSFIFLIATISFALGEIISDETFVIFNTGETSNPNYTLIINSPINKTYTSSQISLDITIIGNFSSVQYSLNSGNFITYTSPTKLKLKNGCYNLTARGLYSGGQVFKNVYFCVNFHPAKNEVCENNLENEKAVSCGKWVCKDNIIQRTCSIADISYQEKAGACGLTQGIVETKKQEQTSIVYLYVILLLIFLIIITLFFLLFILVKK